MTPPSSSIRLHSKWQVFKGVAHGLRQATLVGRLDIIIAANYDFGAIDEAMGPLFDERLSPPPQLSGAAESLLYRLLNWHAVAQRQQRIAVFGSHHIVAAQHLAAGSQFTVAIPYQSPKATLKALQWVAASLNQLLTKPLGTSGEAAELCKSFELLQESLRNDGMRGVNTFHLLHAAYLLDIPCKAVLNDIFCFGYGANSRWLNSTQTDQTSALGVQIAASKSKTAYVLRQCGAPAPVHSRASTEQEALQIAHDLGYPVVIKPDDQEQGRGVAAGLHDDASVIAAYREACTHSKNILVEKHYHGEDYRLTVLRDQVVKILHRRPGGLTGDGVHTVAELLNLEQQKPRFRKRFRQTGRHLMEFDPQALGLMSQNGFTPDSVPAVGQFVVMRRKSNISAGGMQTLIPLERAHPDNIDLAIRSTRAVQLDLCGVDLLIPDISRSWLATGGVIIEMNSRPQIGIDLAPEVYPLLLRELMKGDGRIPVNLLVCATSSDYPGTDEALALVQADACNGLAMTGSVFVDGKKVCDAENSFRAAQILLLDKSVTGALCVMTADEILRSGLPADRFGRVTVAGRRSLSDKNRIILEKSLSLLSASRIGNMAGDLD